jgi:DNA-binding transcriptional LysR family regulator
VLLLPCPSAPAPLSSCVPEKPALLKPLRLLTLKAVVGSGSFAVAARDLGYTASAISQQISALERDTGLVLFEREAHGIRPTAAAHRLADLSGRALAALDDLDQQVRELATGVNLLVH